MNENTNTPNAEAIQNEMRIGPFTCKPFSLKTACILEKIGSPLTSSEVDAQGNPVRKSLSLNDIAEALWVFTNWHRPDVYQIINDRPKFDNAVGHLAGQLTMADLPQIQADLAAVFGGVEKAVEESGVAEGEDGEKKGGTGPSA